MVLTSKDGGLAKLKTASASKKAKAITAITEMTGSEDDLGYLQPSVKLFK